MDITTEETFLLCLLFLKYEMSNPKLGGGGTKMCVCVCLYICIIYIYKILCHLQFSVLMLLDNLGKVSLQVAALFFKGWYLEATVFCSTENMLRDFHNTK